MSNLPSPSPAALAHSEKLLEIIRSEIVDSNGAISFRRYMELALYSPGLGYYSAGLTKLGKQGDFVTAPEISSLFSVCLAQQCSQVLEKIKDGEILELGAGSGKMALDLLQELKNKNNLPKKYYILEISAELKQRQQELFKSQAPELLNKITWLNKLPEKPIKGLILANEVLDAMPVNKFRINSKNIVQEFYVGFENNKLVWKLEDLNNSNLEKSLQELNIKLNNNFYDLEINLLLKPWIKSLSDILDQGLILLIDYGFPRAEYYHVDRYMGTLMCHYRHQAHSDPLILTGLQDITAHVDFTAVAEAAIENNLKVSGFTTQAGFLLSCGLLDLVQKDTDRLKINSQIQQLTSPQEMGELFKVIGLTRELSEINLLGFGLQDHRFRL